MWAKKRMAASTHSSNFVVGAALLLGFARVNMGGAYSWRYLIGIRAFGRRPDEHLPHFIPLSE